MSFLSDFNERRKKEYLTKQLYDNIDNLNTECPDKMPNRHCPYDKTYICPDGVGWWCRDCYKMIKYHNSPQYIEVVTDKLTGSSIEYLWINGTQVHPPQSCEATEQHLTPMPRFMYDNFKEEE